MTCRILVLKKLIGGTIPVLYYFKKFLYTFYGYFYTGPVCLYQKSPKLCPCDRYGIFEHPTIPCNELYSYYLASNVFFEIMWDLDEYYYRLLKGKRNNNALSAFFRHCENFWALGRCFGKQSAPSHWLNSVAWAVCPVPKLGIFRTGDDTSLP